MNSARGALLCLVGAITLMASSVGCEPRPAGGDYGTIELAVLDGSGGWFRLRIYNGAADENLAGDLIFDTGCVEAISRTYELTNIPVGAGRSVYFEGFTGPQCAPDSRIEAGYRGGVTISKGERPYYHIPIYKSGTVTALPEDLNLSAAVATAIDFCDSDDDCGTSGSVCYDVARPEYWCVPTCTADADCATIHPAATCDTAGGWCMLYSPYPLNLSEPRAFGAAATLSDGSVAFIGGYGEIDGGALVRTRHLVEVFDQRTGLFTGADAEGIDSWSGGLFGFAELDADRFALVGGVEELPLVWGASSGGLSAPGLDLGVALSDSLIVVNPVSGHAKASALSHPLADPTAIYLGGGQLLVAGGYGADGVVQREAWICEIGDDLGASCEATSPLNTPRAAAAAACLGDGCERVLIFGGNEGGSLAEVFDRGGEQARFTALNVEGLQATVWDPLLCGLELVSGSTKRGGPSALLRYGLNVDGDSLTASERAGVPAAYLGAVARGPAGCFVGGGLSVDGVASTLVSRGDSTAASWQLRRGRFGAAGAVVGGGPLKGMVLFGGGLRVSDPSGSEIELVRGVEVLNP